MPITIDADIRPLRQQEFSRVAYHVMNHVFSIHQDLNDTHRAQTLNYLMLAELTHGKLINFRTGSVQHEFVNSHQTQMTRRIFQIDDQEWREPETRRGSLRSWFVKFVEDVGTGLDLHLYTEAASHFCGGSEMAAQPITIMDRGVKIGSQKMDLTVNGWAFHVTTVPAESMPPLKLHLSRFLNHTDLEGFQWINVTRDRVSFCTLTK